MNALSLNVKTMSSREIAELTEKEHKNVKRDSETMFTELNLDALSFERIYLDSMNRQQTEYLLTYELVQTLITGYSIKLRHAVIQRLNELEKGKVSKVPNHPAIEALPVFQALKGFAELFNLTGNQALLSANKATVKLTGFNALETLGIELVKEVQVLNLIATQIGKELNPPLSAIKTNLLLEAQGFQERLGNQWVPTEKGKPYGIFVDIGKKHSDGTPVTQLKWLSTILAAML